MLFGGTGVPVPVLIGGGIIGEIGVLDDEVVIVMVCWMVEVSVAVIVLAGAVIIGVMVGQIDSEVETMVL